MKKFKSFKSNKSESETKEKEISFKDVKRPITFKEDPSFGKRLNFAIKEEGKDKDTGKGWEKEREREKEREKRVIDENDKFKRKQLEYSKELRKNPGDVNLWLEFVTFQDELEGKKNKKLIERKISILKKAIELNSSSSRSNGSSGSSGNLKLVLEHLRLAEEIEDSSTLMRLWEGYLRKEEEKERMGLSEDFKLSIEYLNFRQKRFLAFNFDQVDEAFSDIFKRVKNCNAVPSVLIQFYLNYFKFLKRGGFNERIVALFQVLIEVNIEQFNYGQVDLEAYEDQWDFGLMEHIGDELVSLFTSLSPGNLNFDENSTDNNTATDNTKNIKHDLLLRWIKLEKCRELMFWHPKNSFDLEGQVIFDDLKDFIIINNWSRDEILLFVKSILLELEELFPIKPFNFTKWHGKMLKTLLPFYKNDWEFVFKLFQTLNSEEVNSILSENRDSLEIFFAFGRFQEFLGNPQLASKVYESLRKRTSKFDELIFKSDKEKEILKEEQLEFKKENLFEKVYELVRSNPGDKHLYMRIIEAVEPLNYELAMEIFNLLDEQQLRLRSFLEEL